MRRVQERVVLPKPLEKVEDVEKQGKQLNLDDVFGTNICPPEQENLDENTEPTDYEIFTKMLKKTPFIKEYPERRGIVQMHEAGECFDIVTREVVLVDALDIRTVAMFCDSDESFLGFLTETCINREVK